MKNRYKISELAEIFDISRQTLIFYHKKGIFVPKEIDKDNGYRYYLKEQMWDLMLILTLKRAGFSLEEIKKFVELKSVDENIDFLGNKIDEITLKIKELQNLKGKLEKRVKNLKLASTTNIDGIRLENRKTLYWYSMKLKNPKDEREMVEKYEKLNKIAKKNGIENLEYINVVQLKDVDRLGDKDILPLLKIGMSIPENQIFEGCEQLEIGECFIIDYKNSYQKLNDTYKDIVEHLRRKNYIHLGYSIEIMKEVAISTEEGVGAILKIIIPVDKIDFFR